MSGYWLKAAGAVLLVTVINLVLIFLLAYVLVEARVASLASSITMAVVSSFVSGVLNMGIYRYYITIAKGESAKLGICLYFIKNYPFRAAGLTIKIGLMMFVWMLPGMGIILFSMFVNSVFLVWAGVIVMFILLVRAILRYSLILLSLAEDPELTLGEAFQAGIAAAKDEKWRIFCLWLSTLGFLAVGIQILQLIFPGLEGDLWTVIFSLLQVPLMVYWGVSSSILYLSNKR